MVEVDFQRFYHLDYRDFYREDGGASRMTLRRMLLLAEHLPPESLFHSMISDRPPVSEVSSVLMDIWSSLNGQKHPRWEQLKRERRAKERELAMQRAREKARKFNAAR
ncbi:hypothetical protein [Corynebacterium sp. HMSC05D03]|uniref:hypothetical protein n=1 Tax=Corynebacterium sp. HMSC05D03 TaxID=1581115 RepID=UPI0008A41BB6|nr:hypothetical protein [Corynebacterium sp. HMSC05D03]OFT67743.1 hypothetical protein HMPREF3147_01070 [Corynebacterium sp. HMSC05D03]